MSTKTVRYHISLCKHRTTITLDRIVSDLLAIKLGVKPEAEEAHSIVRLKLEELIAPYCKPLKNSFPNPTQWVSEKAILYLVDNKLSKKYKKLKP